MIDPFLILDLSLYLASLKRQRTVASCDILFQTLSQIAQCDILESLSSELSGNFEKAMVLIGIK